MNIYLIKITKLYKIHYQNDKTQKLCCQVVACTDLLSEILRSVICHIVVGADVQILRCQVHALLVKV